VNVLSEENKQQVLALGRLGWSLRRIERAVHIRRETVSTYLKAAGIPVRPPGGWGRGHPKPAIQVSTDPGHENGPAGETQKRTSTPSDSACEPYREFIEAELAKGRNAMAIWQDLVDGHGFAEKYASVKRFVRKLRGSSTPEARVVIETAPGEEAQVDYGTVRNQNRACIQKPIGSEDLERSLLRALEPMLGTGLNWDTVRSAVARLECHSNSERVSIRFHDGTQTEYTLPKRTRPGMRVAVTSNEEDVDRIPRVSRLMALRIKLEGLVREKKVPSYRNLAEAGRVSRARLSQILRLADLAPEIQEHLLFLPKIVAGPDPITEKVLRHIARCMDWEWQRSQFRDLRSATCG